MQPILSTLSRTAARNLLPLAIAATSALGQSTLEAHPYGMPSECLPGGPAALGLYLVQPEGGLPTLRLEGGQPGAPAAVLFGGEPQKTPLPGGGTLLVGRTFDQTVGFFDAHGIFEQPLAGARFDVAGDVLFAQGTQPMFGKSGTELSGGLRLLRKVAPVPPDGNSPPPPDEILVEEFAGMLRTGYLEAAMDLALNSTDDALTFDLSGNLEVPIVVVPGVTLGGKAAFKASIKRGEDRTGVVVYDVSIGADVAAAAGVGLGAGGMGANRGVGGEIVWRFASTHEVARALRSMAILQAVGPRLEATCLALDTQLANIDRVIAVVRNGLDFARRWVQSRMPWRSSAVVQQLQQRLDSLRAQRRELSDRIRNNIAWLISWVADARTFLTLHLHGFEARMTSAMDANIGTGFGDAKASGQWQCANLGASAAIAIERQFGVRTELVPESGAMAVEHKATFTKSIVAAAGFVGGVAVAGKRVLELRHRIQVSRDGLQRDDSGTTVKLTLDGKLLLVLGAVVTGQAGVGGEVSVEMRLEDLLDYSSDAIATLLGDDDHKAAELLCAFPIKFMMRGRYEAGMAIGISIDLDGAFKAGIGGAAMMVDVGPSFVYEGGSGASFDRGNTLPRQITEMLVAGPIESCKDRFAAKLDEVGVEVAHATQR